MTSTSVFGAGVIARNPAWVQMLGLCPLLAVSSSVVNALGLALASAGVLIGSNTLISLLRRGLPEFARLPAFMLLIAGFTTLVVLLLEAFAYELYVAVALFIQIIVTNCMILGRAEAFASRQPVRLAFLDAAGTAAGFAVALLLLGAAREVLGNGTLFDGMERLFGDPAAGWRVTLLPEEARLLIAVLPPGAFIVGGLLLALGRTLASRLSPRQEPTHAES
jgi:electron transport complex protein RnfE